MKKTHPGARALSHCAPPLSRGDTQTLISLFEKDPAFLKAWRKNAPAALAGLTAKDPRFQRLGSRLLSLKKRSYRLTPRLFGM